MPTPWAIDACSLPASFVPTQVDDAKGMVMAKAVGLLQQLHHQVHKDGAAKATATARTRATAASTASAAGSEAGMSSGEAPSASWSWGGAGPVVVYRVREATLWVRWDKKKGDKVGVHSIHSIQGN